MQYGRAEHVDKTREGADAKIHFATADYEHLRQPDEHHRNRLAEWQSTPNTEAVLGLTIIIAPTINRRATPRPHSRARLKKGKTMVEITYRDALRQALQDGMRADPKVVVMGEEVGLYGGAYGVTKGLIEEFGAERLLDTPISEPAIVGAAVGAAMTGLRPVAELMYVDFLGMTMDQLANQAAKIRYMFGGQIGVPIVLRTQGGTGRSAGAQHSQSLEAWVMHTPGLRLAMPATAADAYHLLRHSLTLPDPVVFIEHKSLYTMKQEANLETPEAAWGKAVVRHPGDDVTVVTYSRMVHHALDAARELASEGVKAEVIDLRTLNPFDIETVVESVNRTGRAVAVSEGVLTAGVAAEIAARISEECFDYLEDPVVRIAGEDIPIPVSPALEAGSIPSASLIRDTVRRMVRA